LNPDPQQAFLLENWKKFTKSIVSWTLDLDSESGSGSTKSLNPDSIRIHNPSQKYWVRDERKNSDSQTFLSFFVYLLFSTVF
jgi:hypothetical protein